MWIEYKKDNKINTDHVRDIKKENEKEIILTWSDGVREMLIFESEHDLDIFYNRVK